MSSDEKRRFEAERAREARERFKHIVPEPAALDGLPVLHTFRVPTVLGRPLEFKGLFAAAILICIVWVFLIVVPEWNPWISLPIACVTGWHLSRRYFHGDGKKIKHPYHRDKLKNNINYTVTPGPLRPMNERYEYIVDSKAVDWEGHPSE